jgi:glutamyl-tRNA synthetase
MSSTPKHLAMYNAFGWQPPAFAHVGLLMDENRQKLSKRKLDIDISAFRDKSGIFPEALTNYVALLGWSHGQRSDIMSLQQLVENVSIFIKIRGFCRFDVLYSLA